MSQTTHPPPPFASKEDFFARGLIVTTLEGPLDCSICREPLATTDTVAEPTASQLPGVDSTCFPRITISQNTNATCSSPHLQGYSVSAQTNHLVSPEQPLDTNADTDTYLILEYPIQIAPCSHTFGATCLKTWFLTTTSNRCPSCNLVLFPRRRIHLAFREPTRAMRTDFADVVEHVLGDHDTAHLIRWQLMGEWTRLLMRELTVEMHVAQGFEVSWEYVDRDWEGRVLEEEENEEEDGEEDVEEMNVESEYEGVDGSDDDDDDDMEC